MGISRRCRSVIVGTDWWTDSDDVVAMRVLVWAEQQGMVKIAAVGMSACMPYSAASLDAFLTAEGRPGVRIGIDIEATDFGKVPKYQKNMAERLNGAKRNEDCEDAVRMYRRTLAEMPNKLDLIEIGYQQVLAALLQSPGDDLSPLTGLELVTLKVNKLWVMAGHWENDGSGVENNFARNRRSIVAGHHVCAHWPTPITFLGWEVSNKILTGGTLPEDDNVALALRDHGFPNGRSSWDPMLVLLACLGDEEEAGYRTVVGTAHVDVDSGRNSFDVHADGKHAYVVKVHPDEVYREAIDRILESCVRSDL
ncbi:hypothetical protein [Paenibacillus qinlingensis]|uniref:Inosine/uridine-preferring nucleoside hydrolase domain-containing protein n=1 Tax=Paenibacillus qinlingensis TaxID=1837343 RepID=A0ABU1NUR4_9BACL|nr:hypothetical protein [Paenibacillus qinlingensis]MDR6550821.1 hypothetical protein [Paenibacillus qinlingensis]